MKLFKHFSYVSLAFVQIHKHVHTQIYLVEMWCIYRGKVFKIYDRTFQGQDWQILHDSDCHSPRIWQKISLMIKVLNLNPIWSGGSIRTHTHRRCTLSLQTQTLPFPLSPPPPLSPPSLSLSIPTISISRLNTVLCLTSRLNTLVIFTLSGISIYYQYCLIFG